MLIKCVIGGLLIALLNPLSALADHIQPKLGVQLHSVREQLTEDFTGTLEALARMGFSGVEFAGRYGPYDNDPEALKEYLASIGLQASGAHVPLSQLQGENGVRRLQFFKALGAKLVIIPHDKRIDDPDKIDELIAELSQTSARANAVGLALGYHNHAKEFKAFKKQTFWDYLAQNTPEQFVLQLDAGWVNYAGMDPIEYVKRYPNRTLTTHYKIRTYQGKPGPVASDTPVLLGQDNYDWAKLIQASIQYGATQWIVLEQEEYPQGLTPLQSVEASFNGLQRIIQQHKDLRGLQ